MLPDALTMLEVTPRDVPQNETTLVGTAAKLRLTQALVRTGARRIEATSFMHPGRVPRMEDPETVTAGLPRRPELRDSSLVLNRYGAERAIAASRDGVTCVVVASERFSKRNQGTSISEGLVAWRQVAVPAHAAGRLMTL